MSSITEFKLDGKSFYFQWPAREFMIDVNGVHFSCTRWPDRLSDCRINGKVVSQTTYRRRKDEWKKAK
jgi:hypothetical protein